MVTFFIFTLLFKSWWADLSYENKLLLGYIDVLHGNIKVLICQVLITINGRWKELCFHQVKYCCFSTKPTYVTPTVFVLACIESTMATLWLNFFHNMFSVSDWSSIMVATVFISSIKHLTHTHNKAAVSEKLLFKV